jgi:hypothetical protein
VSGKTTILVVNNLASANSQKAHEVSAPADCLCYGVSDYRSHVQARARGVRIMTRDEMNAALGGVEGGVVAPAAAAAPKAKAKPAAKGKGKKVLIFTSIATQCTLTVIRGPGDAGCQRRRRRR